MRWAATRRRRGYVAAIVGTLILTLGGSSVLAGEIEMVVVDGKNVPIVGAVVYAYPVNGKPPMPEVRPVTIDQVDKEFQPSVTVVPVNTPVYFPNDDNIRHHVYSLSNAKVFELPLYSGRPAKPVIFDKPGAVVLGCNIHDWMVAYVFVVDTPFFAKTGADGGVRLHGLEEGRYSVFTWHPRMRGSVGDTEKSGVSTGGKQVRVLLKLKPEIRVKRFPAAIGGGGY